jgi:Cu2+-containing amine oxidase
MRQVAVDHPLAPLTADEVSSATEVLRREGRLGETVRVHGMLLREPAKAAVLAFEGSSAAEKKTPSRPSPQGGGTLIRGRETYWAGTLRQAQGPNFR